MPEYTALAVLSVLVVLLLERFWFRSGLLRQGRFWLAMAIVYAFHVLVDGWLTKLSAPIVIYDEGQITGVRIPWDIPVEDYLFGFSMIVLTLLFWLRAGRDELEDADDTKEPPMTREDWDLADAFDRAAPTYDAMVALSPGYHDQLRTAAEALVQRLPTAARRRRRGAGDGARPRLRVGRVDAGRPHRLVRPGRRSRRPAGHRGRRLRGDGRPGPREGAGPRPSTSSSPTPWRTSSRWPTGRSTASSAPTCCATSPTGRGWCARWPACWPRVGCSPSTTTPSPGRCGRGRPGRPSATASSSRSPWSRAPTSPCTATSTRACATSTPSRRSADRLLVEGLVDVRHRSYPGWQDGVVHTVVGSQPS